MREGIGSVALYNIIIVFIFVTFSVLAGTMSYSKAFKTNNRIINAIEKYEGYNINSSNEIDEILGNIGYRLSASKKCSKKRGYEALSTLNSSYDFCVYEIPEETREWNGRYSTYGVITYIYLDMPVVGDFFKIPVYGQSKQVFSFNAKNAPSRDNLTVTYDVEVEPEYLANRTDCYIIFSRSNLPETFDDVFNVIKRFSDGESVSALFSIEGFNIKVSNGRLNIRVDGELIESFSYCMID